MTHEWAAARLAAHQRGLVRHSRSELLPVEDAVGRVLSEDISALTSVPGTATSAMDGWAVAGHAPWLIGEPINAGEQPQRRLVAGRARPISTGAVVPEGATAILRSEDGLIDPKTNQLSETNATTPGAHIRPEAEEAARGETVLQRGMRLTPPRLAVAAICGHDHLPVIIRPTVDLRILGNEILTSGIPPAGMVRDAFGPLIPPIIAAFGGEMKAVQSVSDTAEATIAALAGSTADIIVTTGGSSRGRTDHIRTALTELGAELLLDGVRMRPGRPLILAAAPTGQLVLALPGNPLAAVIGLLSIGEPLLTGLLGQPITELDTIPLGTEIKTSRRETALMPYRLERRVGIPTAWQSSAMLRGLAGAAGICVIPPDGLSAGDSADTLPLPWNIEASVQPARHWTSR